MTFIHTDKVRPERNKPYFFKVRLQGGSAVSGGKMLGIRGAIMNKTSLNFRSRKQLGWNLMRAIKVLWASCSAHLTPSNKTWDCVDF